MVPVVDAAGRSVPLPTTSLNQYGYAIEFDASGKYEDLTIDFDALAEHLYQLHVTAARFGSGIGLVIFDNDYLPRLFATPRGDDEHYHVDFAVTCKPLTAPSR